MDNKQFTEAESLEIITSAIRDSRSRMARRSGTPFLVWGYVIAISAIVQSFTVRYQLGPVWQASWLIALILGLAAARLLRDKAAKAESRSDRSLKLIWYTLATAAFIVFALTGHLFTVALLLGAGTVITGAVTAERSLIAGGIVGIATSAVFPIHKFFFVPNTTSPDAWIAILASYYLIFAAVIVAMMIIPGHIILCKYKNR